MAQPLPANTIVQVTIEYDLNEQRMLNVLHYQTRNGSASDYSIACRALLEKVAEPTGILQQLLDCVSEQVSFKRMYAQPVYPLRLAAITETLSAIGNVAANALPQNVAAVFTKRSDMATRWGIGSFHIGGIPETFVMAGRLTLAATSAIAQVADECTVTLTAGGIDFVPVLWNIATPARVTEWLRWEVQQTSRVMRRRTVGVGI